MPHRDDKVGLDGESGVLAGGNWRSVAPSRAALYMETEPSEEVCRGGNGGRGVSSSLEIYCIPTHTKFGFLFSEQSHKATYGLFRMP